MRLERVSIPGKGVTLAGLVYSPGREPARACVVVSHGFTASKESVDLLAAYLCGRGFQCVTFDFRGHKLGGSTGELAHAQQVVDDLAAVVPWALEHTGHADCWLMGHSMGGLVSLLVGAQLDSVCGVAAIASGPRPTAGFHGPVGQAMLVQRADYVAGCTPMQFFAQLESLAPSLSRYPDKPVLLVAAKGDAIVKACRVQGLARIVSPRAQYEEVEGSHLEAPNRSRAIVAGWLERNTSHP